MPKEVVLFACVGNTDLQVLVKSLDTLYRAEVGGDVYAFHSALWDEKRIKYTVDESHWKVKKTPNKERFDWFSEKNSWSIRDKATEPVKADGDKFVLVPPKLAEIVLKLKEKGSDYEVIAAVIFNTKRDATAIADEEAKGKIRNEPHAVGPIIAQWLGEIFDLDFSEEAGKIGCGISGWVDLLDGAMMQEGPNRDTPVNRMAVARMDKAVREASQWGEKPLACLAVGGGFPNFKETLKACAAYRFPDKTFTLVTPEMGESPVAEWRRPEDEAPPPAESFRIRTNAARLIRAGDFSGAWSAVQPLASDPEEKKWTENIGLAADHLAGNLTRQRDLPWYLTIFFDFGIPRCVLAAIRTEAALCGARIPEAVMWTCTFFEAALRDYILRMFQPSEFDEFRSIMTGPTMKISKKLKNPHIEGNVQWGPCLVKLTTKTNSWEIRTGGGQNRVWLEEINNVALQRFSDALNKERSGRISPKGLRNALMHRSVPPDDMAKAAKIFVEAGLWQLDSSPKTGLMADAFRKAGIQNASEIAPGMHFLGHGLARGVLRNLLCDKGVEEPVQLYQALVTGLQRDMADHVIT